MNKMKPIIFSTPMVQAILDGRKTQTRRVIKPQPQRFFEVCDTQGNFHLYDVELGLGTIFPKYQIGDILWVREAWSRIDDLPYDNYVYRTNYGTTEDDSFPPSMFKWKPSIHMPREAARIFLKVTNVRVERLQDITEDEAIKEGAKAYGQNNCSGTSVRIAFAEIWDKATTEHEWRTNPWVWVYEFERVNEDGSSKGK